MTETETPQVYEARGNMVSTPPGEEIRRRIRAGEMPFSVFQICTVEPSHYMPAEQAGRYAARIAACLNAAEGVPTGELSPGGLLRLRGAVRAALDAAEEEGVHRHRGTDEPRRFVAILREALTP